MDILKNYPKARKERLLYLYNKSEWYALDDREILTFEDIEDLGYMWSHDEEILESRVQNWDKLSIEEKKKSRKVYRHLFGVDPPERMKL